MADRGGHSEYIQSQGVEEVSSNFTAPFSSMGYGTEFQRPPPYLTKENPGELAGSTEVVFEAVQNTREKDSTAWAARHPIIALHWGIAA